MQIFDLIHGPAFFAKKFEPIINPHNANHSFNICVLGIILNSSNIRYLIINEMSELK